MQPSHTTRGFSLVEMLVYVAILTLTSVVIVDSLVSMISSYRYFRVVSYVESTGVSGMERMTREIRSASSVDTGNSTLLTNPGVLTLVSTSGGVSTTTKFYSS